MQGAVRVQADPHHTVRQFGRSLIGLQLGGWNNYSNQSEMRKSHTRFVCFILSEKEIVILAKTHIINSLQTLKSHHH